MNKHCYNPQLFHFDLTHWGRDEMNNISQTTFSNVFSSLMKMLEFRFKFHWSLFTRVQLTIFQLWIQIMAWRRWGDKPLIEPMMVSLPTHICVARPQWVKTWNTKTTNIIKLYTWDIRPTEVMGRDPWPVILPNSSVWRRTANFINIIVDLLFKKNACEKIHTAKSMSISNHGIRCTRENHSLGGTQYMISSGHASYPIDIPTCTRLGQCSILMPSHVKHKL